MLAFVVLTPLVFAASFRDVPATHPQYAAIESLKNLGIVNGYSDGNFGPNGAVNRVEALSMILKSAAIEIPEASGASGFSDVAVGDWFLKIVLKAKAIGIVNGNPDGSFAPARQVNKAEFLKMLLQSFKKDLSQHQNLSSGVSADSKAGDWYLPYLSYAKLLGIIQPTLDNRLEPNKALTRAECAEIIYKLLIIERGGDTQKLLSISEALLVNVLVNLNGNNIAAALKDANDAVFYTEQALKKSPDEGIVKAANKIAMGFQKLCLGYQAGLSGDTELLKKYAQEAKDLAGAAYADSASTQEIGKKIKFQADVLLQQVSK